MLVLCGFLLWPPEASAEWLIVAGLLAAVAYQAARIYPFTPLAPVQVLPNEQAASERRLRLLIANVRAESRRVRPPLDLVAATGPDVLLTLEPDGLWRRELAVLEPDFPFRLEEPLDNRYGMLLFSRLELRHPEIRYLMDPGVPSFHARLVLRSGDSVHLCAVHPRPPHTFQASFDRDAELLVIGREIHANPEPAIVAGDLNDVGWSHTTRLFQRISSWTRGSGGACSAPFPLTCRARAGRSTTSSSTRSSGSAGSSAWDSSAPTISQSWPSCRSSPKAPTSTRPARRCQAIARPPGA
jgi:endonuclease/exonuclease/phosphatase (EEP) superfamily protein YafD